MYFDEYNGCKVGDDRAGTAQPQGGATVLLPVAVSTAGLQLLHPGKINKQTAKACGGIVLAGALLPLGGPQDLAHPPHPGIREAGHAGGGGLPACSVVRMR